jgi:hypothetical protein
VTSSIKSGLERRNKEKAEEQAKIEKENNEEKN